MKGLLIAPSTYLLFDEDRRFRSLRIGDHASANLFNSILRYCIYAFSSCSPPRPP